MALLDAVSLSAAQVALVSLGLSGAYLLGLAVYRLYLGPLAEFPGPRLAALTLWYEFYYDVVKQGRYSWKIIEMHEKYGPIVRINPYELHISDPDYYDTIYAGPTKHRDKWAWSYGLFGNTSSHFASIDHAHHRLRRAPLAPFFSKRSVLKLEPLIKASIEKLCGRLNDFRRTQEPVNLRYALNAMNLDIITDYAFGKSFNCLEQDDFARVWADIVDSVSKQTALNKQFPFILRLMRSLPLRVVQKLNPDMMVLINFQIDLTRQVSAVMEGQNDDKTLAHSSIFHELMQTDQLPPEEKTVQHLVDEGQTIVQAGQVTTTHMLYSTAFHILDKPEVLGKLRDELADAMPDGKLASLQKLEHLPYLSAVVSEGLRTSYGTFHRLQRVSPDEALVYKKWTIPPGTPLSTIPMFLHDDEKVFPEPKSGPNAGCMLSSASEWIGQHLAMAEIYMTLAAIFRNFDLELYQTTFEDIEIKHDYFNPQARAESKFLRVMVK